MYVIYLVVSFLTWIETLSACLVLEYYMAKTIGKIGCKLVYYTAYFGIYLVIVVFTTSIGYYFDTVYYYCVNINNDTLLYVQNCIWVPLIVSNVVYKKRGILETSISLTVSVKCCITMNYYTLFTSKHDNMYSAAGEF